MKLSEVFIRTKKILLSPEDAAEFPFPNTWRKGKRSPFICWAISDTKAPKWDVERARRIVRGRLGNNIFLEDWVAAALGHRVQHEWQVAHTELEFQQKMQATRHAWLDSLITEFRSKGD